MFNRSPRSQEPPLQSRCDLVILEHCRKWKADLIVQKQQEGSQYTVYFGPPSAQLALLSLRTFETLEYLLAEHKETIYCTTLYMNSQYLTAGLLFFLKTIQPTINLHSTNLKFN